MNRSLLMVAMLLMGLGWLNILPADVQAAGSSEIHVWEMKEIRLNAEQDYDNGYTDVTCWVELKGPEVSKRIYGFWDGGKSFVFRLVATRPGTWQWRSASNQADDHGFNQQAWRRWYINQRSQPEFVDPRRDL